MQAAVATAVGQAGVRSSVLRGVHFAAGVAARATFEDVPLKPEPVVPDMGPTIVPVLGGMIVLTGALMVANSIAGAVHEYRYHRAWNRLRLRRLYYKQAGHYSRSSHEAPEPEPEPEPAAPPPLIRAIAPFDASRAVAAWAQECEAAGIKHRILQRK